MFRIKGESWVADKGNAARAFFGWFMARFGELKTRAGERRLLFGRGGIAFRDGGGL